MKIIYKELRVQNFWSFGANIQTIPLDNGMMNMIVGDNRDNGKEGMSRNGVGKTGLLHAVAFCLYGESFTDIRIDEFINIKNKKKLMVSLIFEIEKDVYQVTRRRKPNSIEVLKNDEPFTLSTTKNEDEDIRSLVGYDFNIFMATQMLTNNINNFVYQKRAPQKLFIENMFQVDLLTKRAAVMKAHNKNVMADIQTKTIQMASDNENNRRIADMITTLQFKSNSWATDNKANLDKFIKEKELAEGADIDNHRCLNKELTTIQSDLDKAVNEISKLGTTIKSEVKKMDIHTHDLETLRNGKCPRCEQDWISEPEILNIEQKIDMIETALGELKEPLINYMSQETELTERLSNFMEKNVDVLTNEQCNAVQQRLEIAKAKIDDIKKETINPFIDQIEELGKGTVVIDDSELKAMTELGEHYKFMIKLLTDSKSFIRKSIINQYVPIVNQYANSYLALLESPNTFTLNDDLTMDIGYMGRKLSIGSLSTGEKIRMSFALSMAFRNFMALTGSDSNILFIDEIMDSGLDDSGYINIIDFLKKTQKSIFVITHKDGVINEFDNIITVVKENGFTDI